MKMSEQISVVEYLAETKDDVNSPTTSTFTSKMVLCRSTIASLEESLDADRAVLKKLKSAVKNLHVSGIAHTNNEAVFIDCLERLGSQAIHSNDSDPAIGSAFLKFAVFTKELSSLLKTLINTFNNLVVIPLESFLKGDLKGVRGDMKRPFDKSWKDYDTKVKQVEREKRQLAKDAGMIRNEISGAEIAEEMEKERRMFQLQMCEYLIKVNEIKTKKGADLLQHLVEYYQTQNVYFSDGCKAFEQFKSYATDLTANLHSVRQAQDEEKRQLTELRGVLKASVSEGEPTKNTSVYNLHQLQGRKEYGNERKGMLLKRSEGLRKAWQKRGCNVCDGFLTISHNNISKPPVKLNLLTSQVKLVPEDKKQFDLVSHNRTYRFMADDEVEASIWVSVISNSKEDALNRVFGEGESSEQNSGVKELTRSILEEIKQMPGNDICCDCAKPGPTWLSTNLGVLLCIECSGIHRDMGVHISRIQSITLDELGTSELLLARSIGNQHFNSVMEGKLKETDKPSPDSDMEVRKSFIRAKYEGRVYVVRTCEDDSVELSQALMHAVTSHDIVSLLQVFAEGVDLSMLISVEGEDATALHLAVIQDEEAIALVDFLVQNSGQNVNSQSAISQHTPLHECAERNNTECMKLLLRSRAKTDIKNARGDTALDIAHRKHFTSCEDLILQAINGKFPQTVHVNVDWNLSFADEPEDFSDDEDTSALLGVNSPAKTLTPAPRITTRPASVVMTPNTPSEMSRQSRTTSYKGRVASPLPPPRPDKPRIVNSSTRRTASDTSRISSTLHSSVKPPSAQRVPSHHISSRSNDQQKPPVPPNNNFPTTPIKSTQSFTDRRDSSQLDTPQRPAKKFFRKKYSQLKGKTRPRIVPHGIDKSEPAPPLLPEKTHNTTAPAPLPRASGSMGQRPTRVKAIYDCQADNEDELTFVEDEIIVVTGVEDNEWWVGHVEHQPHRTGVFPISFVIKLAD